jgi:plasmid stabilization system protein ParE
MRVIIREAAGNDLDRIHAWIAKDRPHSADAVIARILESVERLGRFPYMGHAGLVRGTFEWVVPGLPYIIVYEVVAADDPVAVTAVFHGAQDRERDGSPN